MRRAAAPLLVATLVALLSSAAGSATPDARVRHAAEVELPAVERVAGAGVGSGEAAQAQYDAARRLEGAVPSLAALTGPCRRLAGLLLGYAGGVVSAAEGYDRDDSAGTTAGRRRAAAALAALDRAGRTCRPGGRPGPPETDELASPGSGEAFFGKIVEENHGDEARLYANGRLVTAVHTRAHQVRFVLRRPPGRYRLELRFLRAGRPVWRSVTDDAFLLPATGRTALPVRATNARLQRELERLGRSFPGFAGIYVHDLRTGRAAGWNADTRFPAASTVKLAVLIETLRRWEPRRRNDLRLEAELGALTGWSSNLAANRLQVLLGDGSEALGAARIQAALVRLGATSSTYPWAYRVGTSADADPPPVSARVTTARDLARILRVLAAAADGNRAAERRTGLRERAARHALGLLLEAERVGSNRGLLAGALPPRTPIAQKNGWISDARHTAAIVYGPGGPVIVVVLTYRSGLSLAEAAVFGARVVRVVF